MLYLYFIKLYKNLNFQEDPSSPDPVLTPETKSTSNISLSKVSPHDSASSSTHSFQEHNYLSPELTTPDTPKSPVTPISPASDSLLLEYTDTAQYLAKAAVFITQATDCEFEKRYEEAFNAYKSGISCLLTGVKGNYIGLLTLYSFKLSTLSIIFK